MKSRVSYQQFAPNSSVPHDVSGAKAFEPPARASRPGRSARFLRRLAMFLPAASDDHRDVPDSFLLPSARDFFRGSLMPESAAQDRPPMIPAPSGAASPPPVRSHRAKRKRRHRRYPAGEETGIFPLWIVAVILALLATGIAVAFLLYGPQILKWLAWPFPD